MLLVAAGGAEALTFNVTYDASTASAPAAFFTAMGYAFQYYESLYTDPITINVHVGWGDINGSPLGAGSLGQSLTAQQGNFTYAQIRTALTNDAKTPQDAAAIATLPVADPTGGKSFVMSNAEAKALGLLSGTNTATDGWVGFSQTASWTFDPNGRAMPGLVDFLGTAHHEITEVMGRYGYGQNGSGLRDSPIDLFRYAGANVRLFTPSFGGASNYFSIDQGATIVHGFNTVCCGDLSDWDGSANDSFNAFSFSAVKNPTTPGDRILMDVLGYDRVQFTDSTLTPQVTAIKAVHLIEVRTRVAQARTRHGLGTYSYTQTIAAGLVVMATDMLETRAALADIYLAMSAASPSYTFAPFAGVTIHAVDITELRAFLESIEDG